MKITITVSHTPTVVWGFSHVVSLKEPHKQTNTITVDLVISNSKDTGTMAARNFEVGWHSHIPVTPIERARAVVRKLVFSVHKVSLLITLWESKQVLGVLLHGQDKFGWKVGIEVTEVFEGGSLGHGTTVEDHFDIDLVLYSRSES